MPLIRYPGSKSKLTGELYRLFPDSLQFSLRAAVDLPEYREPFFGAGAIGFHVLKALSPRCAVWLNDIDPDLVCLWRSVHNAPGSLQRCIHDFTPSVEAFYDFKKRDGLDDCSEAERGFRKLALHRMSVSGFGFKSGGPIGGKNQEGKEYTVGCRWTPSVLKRDVHRLHKTLCRFHDVRITCLDFAEVLAAPGMNAFAYIDPPYYVKGGQLYKHAMSEADHVRLAECCKSLSYPWVLSYDDAPRIRDLYSWAAFKELDITYTNAVCQNKKRPKNREVAIFPVAADARATA